MASKAILYMIIVAILVITVVAIAYLGTTGRSAKTTLLSIQLTDPPNVPQGTEHLLVSYSSVQVHISNSNQSGWVSAQGNGTADLLLLVNATKTIANAHIAANSTVNIIRFNITNAKIIINNTEYNVTVPNEQINIAVTGSQKINSSSSAVLIDLFPAVHAEGGVQSNTYVMVPAARAIVINSNSSVAINSNIGSTAAISRAAGIKLGLNIT